MIFQINLTWEVRSKASGIVTVQCQDRVGPGTKVSLSGGSSKWHQEIWETESSLTWTRSSRTIDSVSPIYKKKRTGSLLLQSPIVQCGLLSSSWRNKSHLKLSGSVGHREESRNLSWNRSRSASNRKFLKTLKRTSRKKFSKNSKVSIRNLKYQTPTPTVSIAASILSWKTTIKTQRSFETLLYNISEHDVTPPPTWA